MYAFGDDETPLPETVDLVEVRHTHISFVLFNSPTTGANQSALNFDRKSL
jgi:hypothetical protein